MSTKIPLSECFSHAVKSNEEASIAFVTELLSMVIRIHELRHAWTVDVKPQVSIIFDPKPVLRVYITDCFDLAMDHDGYSINLHQIGEHLYDLSSNPDEE